MASDSIPSTPDGFAHPGTANDDLQAEYDQLREELQRLMTEPIKDFPRIDALVDQLERTQLAFKGQHGIQGNNPNE
ncbi:MAG: hypothetical protein JWR68_2596 [Polaromonas sp.]|nr:hypothetical protein [Polaromonas sp.]